MIKCKLCNKEIGSAVWYSKHITNDHKLDWIEFLRTYYPEKGGYCEVCGSKTRYVSFKTGFSKFCSAKCSNNSPETKKKYKQTCLEKYGVENASQSEEIKEKKIQTCLDHFGVEYSHQSEIVKEKYKQTCLDRYGVENPNILVETTEKKIQTCLERYGVENPSQLDKVKKQKIQTCLDHFGVEYSSQSDIIKEKTKQTNLEKYGVENPSQSDIIKEKTKQTNLERYDTESPLQNEAVKQKIKQTNLERYGVENPSQSEEIKEKKIQTCLGHFGVKHLFQSDDFKEKSKQTNLERYGSVYPVQTDEVKKKIKQTCLEHFGVENPLQSEEIKQKSRQTCLSKYGVEIPSQSDIIKEKSKQTNLERYGVESYTQSDDFKEKSKQTNLEKYGVEYSSQSSAVKTKLYHTRKYNNYENIKLLLQQHRGIELLDTKEEWINSTADTEHKFCCSKHGEFFKKFKQVYAVSCPKCSIISGVSNQEKELLAFIRSIYSGTIIENDRSVLNGKELDIYLPEKSLAIEFDGIYWHSNIFKDKKYHLEKTLECESNNIQLIHIFDSEWASKRNIVKSIIASKLGIYQERFYARKLEIRQVSNTDYKIFSNLYHLQGYVAGNMTLGLYDSNRLLAIASFKKSRYKQNETELLRFCCVNNVQIVGGLSRLINHYIKLHPAETLVSYCDRRYSNGNGYLNSGFELESISGANYFYFKHENILESRIKYQKHKLSKLLKSYNPNLTEQENMFNNGYLWIYDCGNYKFRWVRNKLL